MRKTLTRPEAAAVRARLDGSDRRRDLSGWARAVLVEIRTGVRVPPAIRHPLGFTCVQLYRSSAWGLCMHVWESRQAPVTLTTSPIHSHSWDLSSQVVCGRLENIEIQVAESPSSPTHRVLEITSSGVTDMISPTRRLVCWKYAESARVEAGENYTLPAGTFHVSRPSADGPTATVMLAENHGASPELVLGRLDSRHHVVARQHNSAADLRQIAELTAAGFSAGPNDEKAASVP